MIRTTACGAAAILLLAVAAGCRAPGPGPGASVQPAAPAGANGELPEAKPALAQAEVQSLAALHREVGLLIAAAEAHAGGPPDYPREHGQCFARDVAGFDLAAACRERGCTAKSPEEMLAFFEKLRQKKARRRDFLAEKAVERLCFVELDDPARSTATNWADQPPEQLSAGQCLPMAWRYADLADRVPAECAERLLRRAAGYCRRILRLAVIRAAVDCARERGIGIDPWTYDAGCEEYLPGLARVSLSIRRGHGTTSFLIRPYPPRAGDRLVAESATPESCAAAVARVEGPCDSRERATAFLGKVLAGDADTEKALIIAGVKDIPGYGTERKTLPDAAVKAIAAAATAQPAPDTRVYTFHTYTQLGGVVYRWKLVFRRGRFERITRDELGRDIGAAHYLI